MINVRRWSDSRANTVDEAVEVDVEKRIPEVRHTVRVGIEFCELTG
jgi:hypothetical protein